MATKVQRATSILNALADTTTDPALLLKIADAYVFYYRNGQVLTPNEKAGLFIEVIRQEIKQLVSKALKNEAEVNATKDLEVDLPLGTDQE